MCNPYSSVSRNLIDEFNAVADIPTNNNLIVGNQQDIDLQLQNMNIGDN